MAKLEERATQFQVGWFPNLLILDSPDGTQNAKFLYFLQFENWELQFSQVHSFFCDILREYCNRIFPNAFNEKKALQWTFCVRISFLSCIHISTLMFHKVRIFWEGHKIWKNLPLKIWHYSVTSNFTWKIFSNFVAFPEYPNFIISTCHWKLF